MTLEEMVGHVRRYSRTTESSHSNDVVIGHINDGQREFAKEGAGIWKENYLSLSPMFDVKDNFYFKVTLATASASFPINASSSAFLDITGASVAAFMASSLQGTWVAASATWSSASWLFTITIPGEANIAISSPLGTTYIDATDMLFGGGGSQADSAWVGSFPEDCTVRASLPTGYYAMAHVEWDKSTLTPAPFDIFMSPEMTGDPEWYDIKNKNIWLYPVPDEQKLLHVYYRSLPTDFGAFSATGSGSFSASSSLDAEVQMAPVFYAASQLAEQNFEKEVADRMYARYRKMVTDYKQNFHNANPQMFTNPAVSHLWYKVTMP